MAEAKDNPPDNTVYDWYLVSAEVKFEDVRAKLRDDFKVNVTLPKRNQKVTAWDLAVAQGEAQAKFWDVMNSNPAEGRFRVPDVYIANVAYLGRMTKDEYVRDFQAYEGRVRKARAEQVAAAGTQPGNPYALPN